MPTIPLQAYWRGKLARTLNPDAKTWENILPYAVRDLVQAWLDGWFDDRHAMNRCPYCWNFGFTDLPDGVTRCRQPICWDRNWPKIDKPDVGPRQAEQYLGSFI